MTLHELILRINQYILNPLIGLLFAIGLLVFFWGLAQYILNANSPEGRQTGSRHMIWGVIGMFIMISVWSILWIIVNTFGIDATPLRELQP
jgi:uncharacterized membrane protein YidH (DUF202 family)